MADVQYRQTKISLRPVADERKCFTVFSITCTGGTSQFNSPAQSNANVSTFSISGQMYIELNFIALSFFSEANLSIFTTPHRLTVNSSNKPGVTNQLFSNS